MDKKQDSNRSVFYRQTGAMGTVMDIVIPGLTDDRGAMLMKEIRNRLALMERTLSNYIADSMVSRINRSAPGTEVVVGEELCKILYRLLRYHELTGGYFDFTLGAWTSPPDRMDPGKDALSHFVSIPMQERIRVKKKSVTRLHPDAVIDAGGFGKGIALSDTEKILRSAGISSAFISFGRSSVLALGAHPQGDRWKVGIQDPVDETATLGVVEIMDQTLSISGNSMNNRKKFGSGGHLLDPVNGTFRTILDQVAVVSGDALEAEVLSTACFAAGPGHQKIDPAHFGGVEISYYKQTNR